jgi:hypothetical protein
MFSNIHQIFLVETKSQDSMHRRLDIARSPKKEISGVAACCLNGCD